MVCLGARTRAGRWARPLGPGTLSVSAKTPPNSLFCTADHPQGAETTWLRKSLFWSFLIRTRSALRAPEAPKTTEPIRQFQPQSLFPAIFYVQNRQNRIRILRIASYGKSTLSAWLAICPELLAGPGFRQNANDKKMRKTHQFGAFPRCARLAWVGPGLPQP